MRFSFTLKASDWLMASCAVERISTAPLRTFPIHTVPGRHRGVMRFLTSCSISVHVPMFCYFSIIWPQPARNDFPGFFSVFRSFPYSVLGALLVFPHERLGANNMELNEFLMEPLEISGWKGGCQAASRVEKAAMKALRCQFQFSVHIAFYLERI